MSARPSSPGRPATRQRLTLFLAGDVMTGRGIDQALPHPGDPTLYEFEKAHEFLITHAPD